MPNSFWPGDDGGEWDADGHTVCTVVGECCQKYRFPKGAPIAAYVISADGENYPIRRDALLQLAGGKRVRK